VVEELAAPLRGRNGVVDLMGEFTSPIASTVIGHLLGIPAKGEDEVHFRKLAAAASRAIRLFLSAEKRRKTERASAEFAEYLFGLVEGRGESLREGTISDLLDAAEAGGRCSGEDIARVVAALASVGTGTTSVAGARVLRSLLRHPDQLEVLRGDRALLPNAVEELLRYDSGLVVMPRYVVEDFELRGQTLKKGQLVMLSQIGANRDPRVFTDPERIDVRRDTSQAIAFGFGSHYCVGVNIARVALQSILEAALDFLPPNARLLEDQIRWGEKGLMSQIKSLPVDFGS
jgi:cytochrome P450